MLIVSDLQFPALDCVPGNQYVYVTAVFLFVIHECSDGAVGVGVRDRVIERRLGGVEQEFAVRVHDRDVGAGQPVVKTAA